MNESETPGTGIESGTAGAGRSRRAPTTRRKKTASPRPRKKAASKPKAGAPRAASRRSRDLDGLLQTLAKKASTARDRLATATGDGAQATRRAWTKWSGASRKAIGRLSEDWKRMEPATKAQVLAALLTTLAAASAPLVRKSLKKR